VVRSQSTLQPQLYGLIEHPILIVLCNIFQRKIQHYYLEIRVVVYVFGFTSQITLNNEVPTKIKKYKKITIFKYSLKKESLRL
jgi:hypothetical protein